ncbi:MAG: thiamine diphosphokinase [Candidatus Zixiibacteriota bacterium]|nr:MAG: thiamine diphosphokinase [candidate division Zixibacteria bacterium]
MKDCILFLPGRCRTKHIPYYRKLARGKFKVAVDGGYRFLRTCSLTPDLLIGDLDSVKRHEIKSLKRTRVLSYPVAKDKTDTQLALEYCCDACAKNIDIVQPAINEPDHFTANLLLLTIRFRHGRHSEQLCVRIVNHRSEIRCLKDDSLTLRQARGERVSVIPLSQEITLSCSGTAFDVERLKVHRGMTVSTRNRIIADEAVIAVGGEALLFRLFPPGKRPSTFCGSHDS